MAMQCFLKRKQAKTARLMRAFFIDLELCTLNPVAWPHIRSIVRPNHVKLAD